jgi:hypothetical protein
MEHVQHLRAYVEALECATPQQRRADVRWLIATYLPDEPSSVKLEQLEAQNARLARDNRNYEWLIAELQDSIGAKDSEILMLRKRVKVEVADV